MNCSELAFAFSSLSLSLREMFGGICEINPALIIQLITLSFIKYVPFNQAVKNLSILNTDGQRRG